MNSFFKWAGTGLLFLLASCSSIGFENPFETSATSSDRSAAETYMAQFEDVPIPSDLKVERSRSLVTTAQNGMRVGLVTVSGRVEINSLNNAMVNNMSNNGWALRGSSSGSKTMQIYEKPERLAVIYTYEQTIDTIMEVWVVQRLDGSVSSGSSYAPPASQDTGNYLNNVTQQGLSN